MWKQPGKRETAEVFKSEVLTACLQKEGEGPSLYSKEEERSQGGRAKMTPVTYPWRTGVSVRNVNGLVFFCRVHSCGRGLEVKAL